MITKEALLTAARLKTKVIETEVGELEIRELGLRARAELLKHSQAGDNAELGLVILRNCVPVLSGAKDDELEAISPDLVETISTAVFDLSGLNGDSDIKKN